MTTAAHTNDLNLRRNANAGNGGVSTWASATTLTVTAGNFLDSTGVVNMTIPASTINAALVGVANGTDTALANSTMYYLHAISNSLVTGSGAYFLSTSMTAPVLPTGYDTFKLVGFEKTNGSAQLLLKYVAGTGSKRTHYWDASIAALSGGTATTLTLIDLSVGVPAIDNTAVLLNIAVTPATANDKASFAPAGSVATLLPSVSGVVAAKIQTGQLKVLSKLSSSLAKILYINSAAAGSTDVGVYGFDYSI